jgi:hypothetical protein
MNPMNSTNVYPVKFFAEDSEADLTRAMNGRHPGANVALLIRSPFFAIIRNVVLQTGTRKNADPISRLFTC